jgi:hypothetical protein
MHVVRNIQKPLGNLYHPAKKINEFLGLLAFLVRHLRPTLNASRRSYESMQGIDLMGDPKTPNR